MKSPKENAAYVTATMEHLQGTAGIVEQAMRECLHGLEARPVDDALLSDVKFASECSQLIVDLADMRTRLRDFLAAALGSN